MKKIIYGTLLGMTAVLLIVGISISSGYKLNQFTHKPYVPSQWTLETVETGDLKEISLPYSFSFDGSYEYELTTKIDYQPEHTDPPYLFVSMNHSYFRVFVDEQEIYHYTKEDTPNLSKSPGNVYTAVPLPADYQGKTLRVEFALTLEKGLTYVLSDIYFNDYPSELHRMFANDLVHNCIVYAILLIGIVLLAAGMFSLKKTGSRDAFSIGFFALLVGLYGMTESMLHLQILANPYLSYLINFIVFAAIPIPILVFYKHKVAPLFRRVYTVGMVLLSLNIVLQVCLHFTGIMDIRQTLICTHIGYFASFILIGSSIWKSPKEECVDKRLLSSLVLPIFLGGIGDALLHYGFAGLSERNTAFSQLGVLVSLLIATGYMARNVMNSYQEHLNAQTYKLMAFRDGLTHIYNRTAYNEEIRLLSTNSEDNEDLICVCVDIDGLKKVNDSDGHLVGDQLIQQTAHILNATFSKYGKVFRIGGDEFAALLYNLEEGTVVEIMREMNKELERYNETHTPQLSFSLGYERLDNVEGRDIKECFRRADMKMYAQKEKK